MSKVHSHYENLKVARDAPPDAIRAAYRALTRQHHPDRNLGNAESQRVMSVINVAYGVLSDPVKRSEHDRWIAQSEAPPLRARPVRGKTTEHTPSSQYQRDQHIGSSPAPIDKTERLRQRQRALDRRVRYAALHVRRHSIAYALGGIATMGVLIMALASLFAPGIVSPLAGVPVAAASPVAGYVRAASAPNGQRWPAQSGYVEGYQKMNGGGLSEVVVDNTENDNDMFAKLVSLDGPAAFPVRTFFVAAHSRFTLAGLTTGTYDLRYRNLANGGLLRSPAFILEEVATSRGTQHSATTVKLHQLADGSLQTYSLGDAEF